jgi:hypothetical protein
VPAPRFPRILRVTMHPAAPLRDRACHVPSRSLWMGTGEARKRRAIAQAGAPNGGIGDDDLALMRRIDELFLARPFLGSRRIALMLGEDGWAINRKRIHSHRPVVESETSGVRARSQRCAEGGMHARAAPAPASRHPIIGRINVGELELATDRVTTL